MCVSFLVRIYPSALFPMCAFFRVSSSFRVRFFPMRLYTYALFFRCAFFLCAFFQCAFFRSPLYQLHLSVLLILSQSPPQSVPCCSQLFSCLPNFFLYFPNSCSSFLCCFSPSSLLSPAACGWFYPPPLNHGFVLFFSKPHTYSETLVSIFIQSQLATVFFSSFLVCISWLTHSLNISLFSVIFSFFQFTLLTHSPLPAYLHAFFVGFNLYGFWSVVRNGIFADSRHFLYFSVSLVLPHYETVQFVPPPQDVAKPRSSVLHAVTWSYY